MDFLLAYATSLDAFMPYILSGIKIILRNRNYELEYLVEEIGPGSPAQKAGFRIGDTIISMNGQAVKGVKDLARLVAAHRPGDTVEIVVLRGGKPLEFMVPLAGRP
jgi:S1-C subfamily serine protease